MEVWLQWFLAMLHGVPALFKNPFPYLLLLLMLLYWKRQVDTERKLYNAKLHTVAEGMLQSVFYGLFGGLGASVAMLGLGLTLQQETLFFLWVVALFLMLFQLRYLCFAYSGAVIGVLSLIAERSPDAVQTPVLQTMWIALAQIDLISLFAFIAILHLVEALLVFLTAARRATPVFIHSKRGKLVGAFQIQHVWFVPVFAITPGTGSTETLPPLYEGWPLLSAAEWTLPLGLLLLPAVLSFSDQTYAMTPTRKARQASASLLLYSLILLLLICGAFFLFEWLLIVAILFSFLGHEGMVWYSKWKEAQESPLFVHPKEGLRILAVIPGTPAERTGLKAGEVIAKVNGMRVTERKHLYEALHQNLAFCKLDVLDERGMLRYVKTSIYQKDHHQLGILLAPDDHVPYYMERMEITLWALINNRLLHRKKQPSGESVVS